jgi:hypothetical protein
MMASLLSVMIPMQVARGLTSSYGDGTVRVDTAVVQGDSTPATPVTIDFGGDAGPEVVVRSFEVGTSSPPQPRRRAANGAPARVRVIFVPGAISVELARRVSSGARFPRVDALLPGGDGGMILHLYDVQVAADRLLTNDDNTGLMQQRLAFQESIAQLTADLKEAQRHLDAVEGLAKRQLTPSLEVARARDNADVIDKRLHVLRERLSIVERQLAQWTPMREEVELEATRAELEPRRPAPAAIP